MVKSSHEEAILERDVGSEFVGVGGESEVEHGRRMERRDGMVDGRRRDGASAVGRERKGMMDPPERGGLHPFIV